MTEIKEDKKVEIKGKKPLESEEGNSKEEQKKGELQLRRYRPLSIFGGIDRFFDEIDRSFRDFWRPSRFWDFEPFNLSVFDENKFFRTPLTNISDDGDKYSITAELPGLDKGDLEITIHDGHLEIKGGRKEEYEEKKEGYVRKEYSSSSYHRSFSLPENIEEDKIDATLDKGVLKLTLPKKEEEKKEKKKIEVK
ncbi:MAG: Hsp20/alpha crystallin family protein [Promethearchaeota archaeon]